MVHIEKAEETICETEWNHGYLGKHSEIYKAWNTCFRFSFLIFSCRIFSCMDSADLGDSLNHLFVLF